jgi:hypothetical protein
MAQHRSRDTRSPQWIGGHAEWRRAACGTPARWQGGQSPPTPEQRTVSAPWQTVQGFAKVAAARHRAWAWPALQTRLREPLSAQASTGHRGNGERAANMKQRARVASRRWLRPRRHLSVGLHRAIRNVSPARRPARLLNGPVTRLALSGLSYRLLLALPTRGLAFRCPDVQIHSAPRSIHHTCDGVPPVAQWLGRASMCTGPMAPSIPVACAAKRASWPGSSSGTGPICTRGCASLSHGLQGITTNTGHGTFRSRCSW